MLKSIFSITAMVLALCLLTGPALGGDDEIWMSSAVREAEREGYRLIDSRELIALLESDPEVLVIDARADYEFEAGHIPGSVNLEFDLGDRMDLPKSKQEAFVRLAGPDRDRLMVIYCRSFR